MNLMTAAILMMAGGDQDDLTRKLETMKVTVDFRETSLSDAIDFFREFTGMNVVIGQGVEDARVTLKLKDVSVKSALKLMLHPLDLSVAVREGVLVVTPRAELRANVKTQVYDVRDLLFRIRDFNGPTMELSGPGEPPQVIINIDPEPTKPLEDQDYLLELLKNHIEWGENASIEFANGMLVVVQTKSGHGEVENLLGRLRMFK